MKYKQEKIGSKKRKLKHPQKRKKTNDQLLDREKNEFILSEPKNIFLHQKIKHFLPKYKVPKSLENELFFVLYLDKTNFTKYVNYFSIYICAPINQMQRVYRFNKNNEYRFKLSQKMNFKIKKILENKRNYYHSRIEHRFLLKNYEDVKIWHAIFCKYMNTETDPELVMLQCENLLKISANLSVELQEERFFNLKLNSFKKNLQKIEKIINSLLETKDVFDEENKKEQDKNSNKNIDYTEIFKTFPFLKRTLIKNNEDLKRNLEKIQRLEEQRSIFIKQMPPKFYGHNYFKITGSEIDKERSIYLSGLAFAMEIVLLLIDYSSYEEKKSSTAIYKYLSDNDKERRFIIKRKSQLLKKITQIYNKSKEKDCWEISTKDSYQFYPIMNAFFGYRPPNKPYKPDPTELEIEQKKKEFTSWRKWCEYDLEFNAIPERWRASPFMETVKKRLELD